MIRFESISSEKAASFYAYFAKISFFVYLFFAFFTISLPFQENISNFDDMGSSNPFRQLFYSSLYILSFMSLLPKKHLVFAFIRREKFLTIFLIWSFLTVFWSDYPIVSLKRWIQIFGTVIIILAMLFHTQSKEDIRQYFKAILCIYLPISLISIILVPGAIQWEFPAWRGIAPHKNILGQVSLIGLIVWTSALKSGSFKNKITSLIFCLLSLVLLLGSKSTSSIIPSTGLVCFVGFFYVEKSIFRPIIGLFFSVIYFFLLAVAIILFIYFVPEYLSSVFGFFGKDITLTGRTELWKFLLEESQKHFFHGIGYGGYWVSANPLHAVILSEFFWLPNQGHNGYLDILNETGLIGLLILFFMVVFYFSDLRKASKATYFKWFILAALIVNITESTIFVPHTLTGVLFILAYAELYAELIT